MPKDNLALMILDSAEEGEREDDLKKVARKDAGNSILKAIADGDGEAVAAALQNFVDISKD